MASVLALVESDTHVCCRYRVLAFRPALQAAGHTLTVRAIPRDIVARLRLYAAARQFDVVVVQRKLLAFPEIVILRRFARKLLFDFDDAVWLRDSYSAKGFHSGKRQRRFRAIVKNCDAVTVGNRFLAEHAQPLNRNVVVIPTCVEPTAYSLARHERTSGTARMVWVGSGSTLQGLERNREMLDAIGRAVPGVRLAVVCDRFPTFDSLPVDPVRWNATTEAAEIADSDIGIGWVPDDPWSRGKCGLKLLQYMAAGLAVVANPVGVQAGMITHGETGLLATTTNEWVNAVRSLTNNPTLRKRLGRAGRERVEREYSVACGGRRWLEVLA
ncbi:MAG: glycosyltransferase family 4 protein [Fimbriiglobus sp.]|jgi:glycosyltransferase involved in cell wall biosynthesis|nr:glycosyltransferase family 4 protein [Fimbriiglobus sp.]